VARTNGDGEMGEELLFVEQWAWLAAGIEVDLCTVAKG